MNLIGNNTSALTSIDGLPKLISLETRVGKAGLQFVRIFYNNSPVKRYLTNNR